MSELHSVFLKYNADGGAAVQEEEGHCGGCYVTPPFQRFPPCMLLVNQGTLLFQALPSDRKGCTRFYEALAFRKQNKPNSILFAARRSWNVSLFCHSHVKEVEKDLC